MVIIVTVSVALVIGLNYKTVLASHKIKEVVDAAVPVEGIEIPDNVQIVGLGEASHGSKEFQESKLEMLKMLVEKKDYLFSLHHLTHKCLHAQNELILH